MSNKKKTDMEQERLVGEIKKRYEHKKDQVLASIHCCDTICNTCGENIKAGLKVDDKCICDKDYQRLW